ncbi:MAG TPA: hypothetical protein PLL62_09180 [Candidatus Saccharicenans sp.]|nr:hypothetical protein [Candidatus Saccharicenans sp.]
MLLDLILGLVFFGYLFFNCSLLVLLNRNDVEISIWKQVAIFLFGVFIDGFDNLKAAFKKW